ncbi:MAG: hypothetical protein ABIK82_06920 [Pseudomonadota bacterium]
MREVVAITLGVFIMGITVVLLRSKEIGTPTVAVLLGFAVLAGLAISNYDLVKRFRWKDVEVETFERHVSEVKEQAIEDIRREVLNQKESTNLLISSANRTREALEEQKRQVEVLINKVHETEARVLDQSKNVTELNDSATHTKEEIQRLYQASLDLARLTVKVTWLQAETKNEFGTARAEAATQQIVAELNRIVQVVIPDPTERNKFINDVQNSLPKR